VIETITFYPNGIWAAGYIEGSEPSIVTQNYESSGGETTGPAYDLVDARRNTQITIDTSGETTDFQFDIDLSANITGMDFMILDNHNFADTNSYVSFRYGAGNTGMTPSSALTLHCKAVNLPIGSGISDNVKVYVSVPSATVSV